LNTSDKIIKFLENKGVKHIYTVNGGQIMYLSDALFRSKIKPIFCHHEQAAAMAAEADGRISGLGVCLVTAGPGAINALNGVVGAYVDSSPMLILSGAAQSEIVNYMVKTGIRQHGLQGVNIKAMAESFTKYFKTMESMDDLKEAYKQATTGRKGGVWLEVPLDRQSAKV